jgi:hypothetical protein
MLSPSVRAAVGRYAMFLCGFGLAASLELPPSRAQESPPPAQAEWFEKHVRPILVERCYECHAGDQTQGGLRLDHRDGWRRGGDSGPAILPDQPGVSLLLAAVQYKNPDLQMPPDGVLPAAELAILEHWIQLGAPDPRSSPPESPGPAPHGMSLEDGRRFWSMQPLADPIIPLPMSIDAAQPSLADQQYAARAALDRDWSKTPIDAFLLQQLRAQGLSPAPPASRRDLLRRMSLDLTGLPPTLSELDDFEHDTAPGAIDRCIDRLLSSPQYGVRYGRHWLDVARYADSNGLDENIAYGNAWRYRDYVVDAFNADKPFDRFLEEQIAGDLLPDANRESTTGTGFLVLGAKVLAEPDRDKLVMDTIDEQLDTIGKTFLGMTLGCARCHDHKFDPIQQRDYYALAAIFKGTKTFGDSSFGAIKHWNEISYAPPQEKQQLKEVDAEIGKRQAAWNAEKQKAMQQLAERVRSQAHKYLAAAARIGVDATLKMCEEAGSEDGLHPRVLAHCRKHLAFHLEDPLFARWRELTAVGDSAGIEEHYRGLFEAAQKAWLDAKERDPQVKHLDDPMLEAARLAMADAGGFLAIPAKMEHALDEASIARLHAAATELRLFESGAPDETAVMGVGDRQGIDGLPLHIRGSHRNLGEMVERGFPQVMQAESFRPIFSRRSSGRLELARWLSSPHHPLTARVIVNRVWRWHFGRGLVASTENFGQLGDRPSHPELLDFLARWFIESGWSMKELHRLIMTSSAYQMQSHTEHAEQGLLVDPENRWLWRFRTQRMSAEQIRDSILFVSGQLDLRLGGKSVPLRNRQFVFDHTSIDHTRYDNFRRTIYLPIIRNHLFSLLEQFDYPDPTMPVGDRQATTIAPQSLLLMNSEWIVESAERLALDSQQAGSSPQSRIDWLVSQVLGRLPKPHERERIEQFLAEAMADSGVAKDTLQNLTSVQTGEVAWTLLAQNLLIGNEFFYAR